MFTLKLLELTSSLSGPINESKTSSNGFIGFIGIDICFPATPDLTALHQLSLILFRFKKNYFLFV